jgi:hypothetical protein
MRLDTLVGNMSYASLKALAISSGVCEIYTIVRIGFQDDPNVQVRYRALSSKNASVTLEEYCLTLGSNFAASTSFDR